jgi:hypothetical protein
VASTSAITSIAPARAVGKPGRPLRRARPARG